MCLAPQRGALFRHVNFQKWSEKCLLCTFWLGNVLRATTACTVWTSQLSKWYKNGVLWCALMCFDVLWCALMCFVQFDLEMSFAPQWQALFRHHNFQKRSELTWGAFSFCTCKCASCHNGVQVCIPHLARWLRTRRFSEPTFPPSGATNHWKNA